MEEELILQEAESFFEIQWHSSWEARRLEKDIEDWWEERLFSRDDLRANKWEPVGEFHCGQWGGKSWGQEIIGW